MVKASDVDGINIFDKDDQAAKHLNKIEQCFVAWLSLCQKLHQEAWSTSKNNVYSEVIMAKTLNLSKVGGLGCPFQFHVFFNKAYLVLGHFLFTPEVFLFGFNFFFRKIC